MDHAGLVDVFRELADVLCGRMQHNLIRCVTLLHCAVFHDGDPVCEAQRLVKVVGDKDNRFTQHALQSQKFILHFFADQRIKRAEWFIKEPDIRLNSKGTGNANTLLLAAGQFTREILFASFKSNQLNHLKRPFTGCVFILAAHFQWECYVFQYSAVRKQSKRLKHHPHLGSAQFNQVFLGQRHDVLPFDGN